MSNNLDQLTDWLKDHKITEVECMIGDLTGITRGKISPTNKFIAEKGMRLPESVLLQTVTGEPGSAMHLHQSIIDIATGKNVFSNEDGTMSQLFLNHIGGLQKFIPELLPLFAPNVNSFRRFLPDTSAPVNVEWGEENRTVGLRVPDAGPQNRRVENRLPGADANPDLAIAASLLCGYIGMVEGHNPSAPVVGRGYERRNLRLPLTIEDALERMENSKTIEKYLGQKFITGYVAVKRAEHENFKRVISSWEREFLLFAV